MKKLREKLNNKKGFTLVELIVVIVIILVLAAVLVPSVLKYIEKANKANCKSDAATTLTQLQADIADMRASGDATGYYVSQIGVATATTIDAAAASAITVDSSSEWSTANKNQYVYAVDSEGNIVYFSYANATYCINYKPSTGWSEVGKVKSGS